MAEEQDPFDIIFQWLQVFDPNSLYNEDDVETKFVIPLFQHLGYADDYRRGKFPVESYGSGKAGRKAEVDQIYFSTNERKHQNADTSLVIVEAKAPDISNMDSAIKQAIYYTAVLKAPFLVVTNGSRLQVYKFEGYQQDQRLWDTEVGDLKREESARRFYHQLHFAAIKQAKAHLKDSMTTAKFMDLSRLLKQYPALEAQLAQGDFVPARSLAGRQLTVVKQKVKIVCTLPLAFYEGDCRIEFSNPMLRGLTCQLTHRQILETLLTGLDTSPHWGTRRFLRKLEGGIFEGQLGQSLVILTAQEAQELCDCVDRVGQEYKARLVHAEDVLETWGYLRMSYPRFDLHAFNLLTVAPWLWNLIQRFVFKYDDLKGSTPWHLFDPHRSHFRVVSGRKVEHAQIYAYYGTAHAPKESVDLLYAIDADFLLPAMQDLTGQAWDTAIGPKGLWTATYTERWLTHTLIPEVMRHYAKMLPKQANKQVYWTYSDADDKPPPLEQVSDPKDFADYLHRIQGWLHIYRDCRVAAKLLRPYYAALTNVVRHIDPATIASQYFGYIEGNLAGALRLAQWEEHKEQAEEESDPAEGLEENSDEEEAEQTPSQKVEHIISLMETHVRRIEQADSENQRVADYVSRGLIALLEDGTIHCSQAEMNAAREVLRPLLELSRFEERYILRDPWGGEAHNS
jgi:hypothetical protein